MTERRPLVLVDGKMQELPADDTLPGGGGGEGGGIPDAPSDDKTYGRKNGDWVEVTSGGGGGGGAGPVTGTMSQPYVVQKSVMRNDGTISLVQPPTPGNLLLYLAGGWSGSLTTYKPADMQQIFAAYSDGSNGVLAAYKTVADATPVSYALSASDNQFCALYEIANCGGLHYMLQSTAINFASSRWSLAVPTQNVSPTDLFFCVLEHDPANYYTIDDATGLTKDFLVSGDGNHPGFIVHYNTTFVSPLVGGVAGVSGAIAAVLSAVGKFTPD